MTDSHTAEFFSAQWQSVRKAMEAHAVLKVQPASRLSGGRLRQGTWAVACALRVRPCGRLARSRCLPGHRALFGRHLRWCDLRGLRVQQSVSWMLTRNRIYIRGHWDTACSLSLSLSLSPSLSLFLSFSLFLSLSLSLSLSLFRSLFLSFFLLFSFLFFSFSSFLFLPFFSFPFFSGFSVFLCFPLSLSLSLSYTCPGCSSTIGGFRGASGSGGWFSDHGPFRSRSIIFQCFPSVPFLPTALSSVASCVTQTSTQPESTSAGRRFSTKALLAMSVLACRWIRAICAYVDIMLQAIYKSYRSIPSS